tara:strand:- start:315 stop:920 length:606 start_codon:yes stop_codon:yes gene_type:complete
MDMFEKFFNSVAEIPGTLSQGFGDWVKDLDTVKIADDDATAELQKIFEGSTLGPESELTPVDSKLLLEREKLEKAGITGFKNEETGEWEFRRKKTQAEQNRDAMGTNLKQPDSALKPSGKINPPKLGNLGMTGGGRPSFAQISSSNPYASSPFNLDTGQLYKNTAAVIGSLLQGQAGLRNNRWEIPGGVKPVYSRFPSLLG